jgi:DNA-directed RNA polymerase specialized sigma24 family protein
VFELKKEQEQADTTAHFALIHRKCNDGPLLKPMGFCFNFEDHRVVVQHEDMKSLPEMSQHLSVRDRLVEELRHGSLMTNDLSENLDVPEAIIRVTLHRGKDKVFTQLNNHQWGLLAI